MKAVLYGKSEHGKYSFYDGSSDKPSLGARDLLVEVQAISVNPVDYKVRNAERAKQSDSPVILGWDAAGTVVATGDKSELFKPGDKVYYAGSLNRSGSNAQFQAVDERLVGHMPKSLSFEQAAALPLTGLTAWELIFDRFKLTQDSDNTVLVTAAAGGVGSILIQLLNVMTNTRVIATYGRDQSKRWLEDLGADITIKHSAPLSRQLAENNINGVDYIFSLGHTDDYIPQFVETITPQGALAFIDEPQQLDIGLFKSKSVAIHTEFMFTRSMYETQDMIEQHRILENIARLIDQQAIKTTLNEVFGTINAENIQRAHDVIESGQSRGKIVLSAS